MGRDSRWYLERKGFASLGFFLVSYSRVLLLLLLTFVWSGLFFLECSFSFTFWESAFFFLSVCRSGVELS